MSLNFELAELNIDAILTVDPAFEGYTESAVTGDSTATMSASGLLALFKFATDSKDLLNENLVSAADVKFEIVANNWPKLDFSLAAVENAKRVNYGSEPASEGPQTVDHDMVRHLAKEITGGYGGADIFNNEVELRGSITTADTTAQANIQAILSDAAQLNVIGDKILRKMLSDNVGAAARVNKVNEKIAARSADISNNVAGVSTATMMTLPFLANDTLVLQVNYKSKSGTDTVVPGMGVNTVADRSYRMVITLTA